MDSRESFCSTAPSATARTPTVADNSGLVGVVEEFLIWRARVSEYTLLSFDAPSECHTPW